MTAFKALTKAQWRGFWRDRQNLFWIIGFPLMFLLLFGAIFRDAGAPTSRILELGPVPVIDAMPAAQRADFDRLFTVTPADDLAAATEQVRRGDVDAVIRMERDTVVLAYSQADPVRAGTMQGALGAYVQSANIAASGVPPKFSIRTEPVEDESLTVIQTMAPGLLGWAVAMGAVFGAAMPLVTWRTNTLLRRLRLAPIRTEALIASRTVVSVAVALIQTALFLGVGRLVFGMTLRGSWLMAVPLVICGTLAFMSIGLVAGAVSKTAEGASGLANLIVLPMAFLSGSFIQLDSAPDWLVSTSRFLPLGHLNTGLSDVMVRGRGPEAALLPIAVLIGFALVFSLIAARLFRWES